MKSCAVENQSTNMEEEERQNSAGKILLGCTGSVASVKIPIIVDELLKHKVAICSVIM